MPIVPTGQRALHRLLMGVCAGAILFATTGCVHRRMTIDSVPQGAQVLLDGENIGYTPASINFDYYGTHEVTLRKDGYETHTSPLKVPMPWYQVPPLDFVSDNFLPFKARDRQYFSFQLQPKVVVPTEELLNRANVLRSEAQVGP